MSKKIDIEYSTLTRNGTGFVAELLARLQIKTTYGASFAEIFPAPEQTPVFLPMLIIGYVTIMCVIPFLKDNVTNHVQYHADLLHYFRTINCIINRRRYKPSVRVIRNPAAAFLSYYIWHRSLYLEEHAPSIATIIDCWLEDSAGGTFMLGYIEEYFLQNMLLKENLGEEAFFYFEKFKNSPDELMRLLQLCGLRFSWKQVCDAHEKQLIQDASASRNRSNVNNLDIYIAKRIAIMENVTGANFGYTYDKHQSIYPKCSWSLDTITEALKYYTDAQRLSFPHTNEILTRKLSEALFNMAKYIDYLPILEIHLAGHLYLKNTQNVFSLEVLTSYASNNENIVYAILSLYYIALKKEKFYGALKEKVRKHTLQYNFSITKTWFSAYRTPVNYFLKDAFLSEVFNLQQ